MTSTKATHVSTPNMRIRLPPQVEQTVAYLVSKRGRDGHRRRKGEAALDNWSWAHVASGAGLALAGLSWGWTLALLTAFEGIEAGLRRFRDKEAGGLFEYESWPNVVADIVTGMIGFAGAKMVMGKPVARAALSMLLPLLPTRAS